MLPDKSDPDGKNGLPKLPLGPVRSHAIASQIGNQFFGEHDLVYDTTMTAGHDRMSRRF
jgi:hypothetical protein